MRKILGYTLLLLLGSSVAMAQFTTVTATVVDQSSTTWANAPYSWSFQPGPNQSNPANYTYNGAALASYSGSGAANGSGVISVSGAIYDVTLISPIGASYNFTVCPNASSKCSTINFKPSGGSVDIGAAVNAAITTVSFNAIAGAYGYNDAEALLSLLPGSTYWNVTSSTSRCYTGGAWGACTTGAAGGTVTSVTFTGDNVIDSNTPSTAVTTTGTVTATPKNFSANTVVAGPTTGSAATPTARLLVSADIPNNAANTSGTAANLSGTPLLPTNTTAHTDTPATGGVDIATNAYADAAVTAGGTISGQANQFIPLGCSAITICAQSHISDDGTKLSTTENLNFNGTFGISFNDPTGVTNYGGILGIGSPGASGNMQININAISGSVGTLDYWIWMRFGGAQNKWYFGADGTNSYMQTGSAHNMLFCPGQGGVTSCGGVIPLTITTAGIGLLAGTVMTANQGTGVKLQHSTGTVTSTNCVNFDATGNTADAGAPCVVAVSAAVTSATGGTNTGTVTCVTASCTNTSGTYSVAGGTFTTGNLLVLVWPTTTIAYKCWTSQNGGIATYGIGHSVATATGMTITAGISVAAVTVTIDYGCSKT